MFFAPFRVALVCDLFIYLGGGSVCGRIKVFLYVLLRDLEFSIDKDVVIEKRVKCVFSCDFALSRLIFNLIQLGFLPLHRLPSTRCLSLRAPSVAQRRHAPVRPIRAGLGEPDAAAHPARAGGRGLGRIVPSTNYLIRPVDRATWTT